MSLVITYPLLGCGIGGWWMNGNPVVGREPYRPEYLDWFKYGSDEGITKKKWQECGGAENGMIHLPKTANNFGSVERSKEYDKKYDEVEGCMMKNGYQYKGSCKGPIKYILPCRAKK